MTGVTRVTRGYMCENEKNRILVVFQITHQEQVALVTLQAHLQVKEVMVVLDKIVEEEHLVEEVVRVQ